MVFEFRNRKKVFLTVCILIGFGSFSEASLLCHDIAKTGSSLDRNGIRESLFDDVIDLKKTLLQKSLPAEWVNYVDSVRPFPVLQKEGLIRRKTLRGQNYIVSYQRLRPAGIEPKATLLLHHGFSRSHAYFHDVIALLLSLNYEVIAFDGANVGRTLLHTIREYNEYLIAPSPLDDALAMRDVLNKERDIKKFGVVGHSRGHAVTSLFLSLGLYDERLLRHFPVNPYVNWLVDYQLDHDPLLKNSLISLMKQATDRTSLQAVPIGLAPYSLGTLGGIIANIEKSGKGNLRAALNALSIPAMAKLIQKSFHHQQSHEVIGEIPTNVQIGAVVQIGRGLAGKDGSREGFSVLPSYNSQLSALKSDNGFGFKIPGVKFHPLSLNVKSKTIVITGDADDLITDEIVAPLLETLPNANQFYRLTDFRPPSTNQNSLQSFIKADHYVPDRLPAHLVGIIDSQMNQALAQDAAEMAKSKGIKDSKRR